MFSCLNLKTYCHLIYLIIPDICKGPEDMTEDLLETSNLLNWLQKAKKMSVLGLAWTRVIFIRIQEGAQPGGLTPPGQTEQDIPYHVPSR